MHSIWGINYTYDRACCTQIILLFTQVIFFLFPAYNNFLKLFMQTKMAKKKCWYPGSKRFFYYNILNRYQTLGHGLSVDCIQRNSSNRNILIELQNYHCKQGNRCNYEGCVKVYKKICYLCKNLNALKHCNNATLIFNLLALATHTYLYQLGWTNLIYFKNNCTSALAIRDPPYGEKFENVS